MASSMRQRGGRLAIVLVAGFASLAGTGRAESPPGERDLPVFGADVSIVSLPVFVVDKSGQAMRGLHAEDFELFDDGKRVGIASFQYVDTTSEAEQQAIRQAPAARRRFLLLFDLSFSDGPGLHRARQAGMDFVRRQLAVSDLASVASFDVHRGIRIVANFSEDRPLLLHAIQTLGAPSHARIHDPLGLAASIQASDIQSGRSGGLAIGDPTGGELQGAFAITARRLRAAEEELYRRQVLNLIGSFEELAKGLRLVEGRKQVLYFSGGFDSQALVGASGNEMRSISEMGSSRIWEVDTYSRYGDNRLRNQYAEMTRLLAHSDTVVHCIDITGLGGDDSLQRLASAADSTRQRPGLDSLQFLASQTGGRLFKDSNDLTNALQEVAGMTSRYYILGYQPQDLAGPGRFHKLKVRVARKGASLSYRAGFFERVPRQTQTPLQRKFEAAQLVMTGLGRNDLAFSALCLPFPERGENQTLGLVVQVPREELRWQAEQPVALEVFSYAVAADGSVHDHLAQLAQVNPAQADPEGKARGLSFYGALRVPPGQYTVKLMVQEPESGAAGVQFLDVTVPPYDARVGFLLPPVVLDDPARWLGLALGRSEAERGDSPFEVEGEPFLPRASFEVEGGRPERLVLMAYDPVGPSDPAASGIEIQSAMTDASGAIVGAGRMKIDKVLREQDGRRTYLLDYIPDQLAPGEYMLRIGVGEAGMRLESYALLRVAAEGPGMP